MSDISVKELVPSALVGIGACIGVVITIAVLVPSGITTVPNVATLLAVLGLAITALQWNTGNLQARTAGEQAATARQQAATSAAGLKLQLF